MRTMFNIVEKQGMYGLDETSYDIQNEYGKKVGFALLGYIYRGEVTPTIFYLDDLELEIPLPDVFNVPDLAEAVSNYHQQLYNDQLEAFENYLELSKMLNGYSKKGGFIFELLTSERENQYKQSKIIESKIRLLEAGNQTPTTLVATDYMGTQSLLKGGKALCSTRYAFDLTECFTKAVRVPLDSLVFGSFAPLVQVSPFDYKLYNKEK